MRARTTVATAAIAAVSLLGFGQGVVQAADIPKFSSPVVDSANVLSANAESLLNRTLENFRQTSGPQIAMLIVDSTGSQSIEDFAIDVGRSWGIGDKTRDDGVLLVIAFDDRRLRIEVGSGAEGELTDVEAGRIIDKIIAPQLRAGDPDAAVTAGATALMQELSAEAGTTVIAEVGQSNSATGTGGNIFFTIITLLFFLLGMVMFVIRGRQRGFGNVAGNALFILATVMRSGGGGGGGGFSGGGGGGFSGGGASGSW